MSKKNNITMGDIAKKVGTSINTVSRALNDKEGIKKETKEKILSVAKKTGYRPNRIAQRMRANKPGILGVLVANNANPFFSTVVKGIEKSASDYDYSIILKDSDENPYKEKEALDLLLSEQIDGLLISPVIKEEQSILPNIVKKIPVVAFARYFKSLSLDYVLIDDELGGYLATQHLLNQGYINISLLNGPMIQFNAQQRLKGYKRAFKENNLEINDNFVYEGALTKEDGYRIGLKILESNVMPDAFHAFSDFVALGLMKAIKEKGLNIPEEIGVVGFDDIFFAEYTKCPLTTIRVPMKKIGAKATEILISKIENEIDSNLQKQIEIAPEIIIRESSLKN